MKQIKSVIRHCERLEGVEDSLVVWGARQSILADNTVRLLRSLRSLAKTVLSTRQRLTPQLTIIFVFITVTAFASFTSDEGAMFDKLLNTGQFEQAKAIEEKTVSASERSYMSAKTFFYKGEYREAAREMELAAGPGGLNKDRKGMALYYEALNHGIEGHETFSRGHYVLKAGGEDKILAYYAPDVLEKVYDAVGKGLNLFPADNILVEIHTAKPEFSLASTISEDVLEKSGTVGICKFNRMMLLSPKNLPLGYSWADTLCHEYVHFVVNRLSGGACPLWLHEGLAKYYEVSWRMDPKDYLSPSSQNSLSKAVKANSFISFKQMHPSLIYLKNQDEILLAFAEVSCAVGFMREKYGDGSISKLLNEMARNGEKEAFKKALGVSEDKFESKFFKYLKIRKFQESPGAVSEKIDFNNVSEEEFIGADLRGQMKLGDRMRELGKYEAAVTQYEKALELEKDNPVILLKISKALISAGDYAGAVERLKAAADKNPGYVTVFETLGETYFKMKDYDNTIEILLKANLLNPYNPALHYCLSRSYLEKGGKDKAVRELKALLILSPDDIETKVLLERITAQKETK